MTESQHWNQHWKQIQPFSVDAEDRATAGGEILRFAQNDSEKKMAAGEKRRMGQRAGSRVRYNSGYEVSLELASLRSATLQWAKRE